MQVQPYLMFNGRCEEALEFYHKALGAEISLKMLFKDSPEPCPQPVPGDKVMHAEFRIGDSTIMATDGMCTGDAAFNGFSLTILAPEIDEAERLFTALGEGGQVQMPMRETFFAYRFGMVADRFGLSWLVLAEKQPDMSATASHDAATAC